jgi:DNA-directed RNA polymerase subunit RPC12/RpoP
MTTTEPTCPKCGHKLLFSDEATVLCKKPVRTAEAKDKSTAETHADDFEACGCHCAVSATEPSVEDCLQELQEMFPDIEVARYDLLNHHLELHLPDQWIKYFDGTLSEAMSRVRAWHREQAKE